MRYPVLLRVGQLSFTLYAENDFDQQLTVLSIAYPLLPVGPGSGGGSEQILFLLERGLTRAGHRSLVIAARGSRVSGELIETPASDGEITDELRGMAQREHCRTIERALSTCEIDIAHFHGLDFHAYVPREQVAKLATLHLPLTWYPPSIFEMPDVHLNCVSETQAASAPAAVKLTPIRNGIDVRAYCAKRERRNYLLWIGRICPEKGVDIALRVAHRLEMPIVIAGPVHPFRDHETYFADKVQPLLDRKRAYVGPVELEQKIELLAGARCVLVPSLAPETSSLVAMEALSSATPVIAFRSGALPEIVEDGRTGFIVDTEEEMATAVGRVDEISRQVCREVAEDRFDSERMIRDYISLYRAIVRARSC